MTDALSETAAAVNAELRYWHAISCAGISILLYKMLRYDYWAEQSNGPIGFELGQSNQTWWEIKGARKLRKTPATLVALPDIRLRVKFHAHSNRWANTCSWIKNQNYHLHLPDPIWKKYERKQLNG